MDLETRLLEVLEAFEASQAEVRHAMLPHAYANTQ